MVAQNIPQQVAFPSITTPAIDRQSGLLTKVWYMFLETLHTRSGGDIDKVNDAFVGLDGKVNTTTQVIAGDSLTGGGTLDADITLDFDAAAAAGNGLSGAAGVIDALQDTGWTASTGTPAKGAYAAYAGQTVSAAYVQAEAQATDDAVKALAARVIALEAALRANGAID